MTDTNTKELQSTLLEEFKSLRQEIIFRATTQAAILSLNVTAIGVVAGLYFSSKQSDARVFFLIPMISSILGLMYTDHALNIGKLARFIRWQVKPRLAETLGMSDLVDYEVYANNYRPPRWEFNHVLPVAIIAMFIAIPVAAIALPFTNLLGKPPLEPTLSNFALAAPGVILLVWFLILYRSVHYGGRTEALHPPQPPVTVQANDYKR